jgi:hypothetical protein
MREEGERDIAKVGEERWRNVVICGPREMREVSTVNKSPAFAF